jgi:hypothetical protein
MHCEQKIPRAMAKSIAAGFDAPSPRSYALSRLGWDMAPPIFSNCACVAGTVSARPLRVMFDDLTTFNIPESASGLKGRHRV